MTNTQINNLLKPAIKWAVSCCANHFEKAFKNSTQYANFIKTGKLKLSIFGKDFYYENYKYKIVKNINGSVYIIGEMDMNGNITAFGGI